MTFTYIMKKSDPVAKQFSFPCRPDALVQFKYCLIVTHSLAETASTRTHLSVSQEIEGAKEIRPGTSYE